MVPNLRVDARIYHTDNTTAVKKATRDSVAPSINTQARLGYLGSLMSISWLLLKIRSVSWCAHFFSLLAQHAIAMCWVGAHFRGVLAHRETGVTISLLHWGKYFQMSQDAQLHLTKPENNRFVFTLTRHLCVKSCKALRPPHYEKGFSPTGTVKFLNVSFQY